MLDRRRFLQRSAAAVAGLAGASRLRTARTDEPARKPPAGRYFDFHVHFGLLTNHTPRLTIADLLRWMDEHDVAQAAVLPLVSPESTTFPLTTDIVLEETRPHRDRLVPFCCFDPRTDHSGGQRGLVGILSRWIEAGARGFGEHKPGVPIDDPRNMKLYAACADLKLPVLFHMDNGRNTDVPGLPGLAKVLAEFPTVNFLGHAHGWWASISGGIGQDDLGRSPGTSPVAPGGAIDALMDKFPNLHGDLSAGAGATAISRDPKFGREFLLRRADRLVFGTDYHFPGQNIAQFDLYRKLDLPPEVERKILRENALRLLRT